MIKSVITNLDLSKSSGPDCIPVVVLKSCEPESVYLKFVSAIFYQIFIFHQTLALQKL